MTDQATLRQWLVYVVVTGASGDIDLLVERLRHLDATAMPAEPDGGGDVIDLRDREAVLALTVTAASGEAARRYVRETLDWEVGRFGRIGWRTAIVDPVG